MRWILLLLVVLCGCEFQAHFSGERDNLRKVGSTPRGAIWRFDYEGKSYLLPYDGGIVEHKAAKEGE